MDTTTHHSTYSEMSRGVNTGLEFVIPNISRIFLR